MTARGAPVIRSLLYVPASSDRFIGKAHERGADAIILDLEDAVVPAEKASARMRLAGSVASVRQRGALVFVRINSEPELLPLTPKRHAAPAHSVCSSRKRVIRASCKSSRLCSRKSRTPSAAPLWCWSP